MDLHGWCVSVIASGSPWMVRLCDCVSVIVIGIVIRVLSSQRLLSHYKVPYDQLSFPDLNIHPPRRGREVGIGE